MQEVEVGKLFKDDVTRYQEGVRFDINDAGCDLFIYYKYPSESEINSIKSGNFKTGFYAEKNAIFMLFKFGSLQWMDAPYSVHLSKNLTRFELFDGGQGLALHIYLIDAATGVLKAIRLIGLKTNFSIQLIEAVEKQKEMSFEGYDININNIMNKYPTKKLVEYGRMMI